MLENNAREEWKTVTESRLNSLGKKKTPSCNIDMDGCDKFVVSNKHKIYTWKREKYQLYQNHCLPLRKNKISMEKELFQYSYEKYGICVVEVSVKYKMLFEGAGAVEWRSKCCTKVKWYWEEEYTGM